MIKKDSQVYIDGLGWRNPITESGQVLWYLEQTAQMKPKAHATRYWIDIMERHGEKLLSLQAYEVYGAIKQRATDAKIIKRELSRKRSRAIAEKETEDFNRWYNDVKAKDYLIKQISLN